MQWIASLVYTAFLFASIFVYALVTLACFWLPFRQRYRITQSWARVALGAAKALCGLDYVVEGLENIPAGAHVSLWKHSSAWETIVQQVLFPPTAWVLKRELLWVPVIGWGMALMRPIAINRSAHRNAVTQVVQQGKQRLAEGIWVLIFPEGTRVAAGERRRFGASGALLASQAGCKVVPVAHDAGLYWARRGLLKRRGTIRVVIGPPIDSTGMDPRDLNEAARAWIDNKVTELGA